MFRFVNAQHQPIESRIPETSFRARVRDDQQVAVDRMLQSLVHAVTSDQSEMMKSQGIICGGLGS
jgi:hypothetical protein